MTSDMAMGMAGNDALQLSIDSATLLVGLCAIAVVMRINRRLGGRINQALRYFILGVLCNVLAIGWSLFFSHSFLLGGMQFDVHQNLMSLGMIFFIVSTARFSKLVQNV